MLDALGINAAVCAITTQTIPALEGAVQRQVDRLPALIAAEIDRAMLQESNIIAGVIQALGATIDRLDSMSKRYEALLARLDGATVTLALRKEE